jgi:thioredoxin-related protein
MKIATLAIVAALSGQNIITDQNVKISPGKKGTVVIFMSTKCPCSQSHMEVIKKLATDFKDFSFVGVHSNSDETREEGKKYFQNAALPFPIIQDSEEKLANELKAAKTPHAFLIATSGEIVYKGGVTNSSVGSSADKQLLRDALNDVENGRQVQVPEGRTLGCVISRGDRGG